MHFYCVAVLVFSVNTRLHSLLVCFFFSSLVASYGDKNCLCAIFCLFFFLSLRSIEEMLRVETVGINVQRLQSHSVVTDKLKEPLSRSIWVKWQRLVKKDLCHWRAPSSLWLKPNNSKPDYTVQHVVDDDPAALG